MTNFVLTITPDTNAIRLRAWTVEDEPLVLEQLQESVGGWIEIVRPPTRRRIEQAERTVAVIDEEGLLKRLQPNHPATEIIGYPRTLVGPAVICVERMSDEGPELLGLSRDQALEVLSQIPSPGPTEELLDSASPYGDH